MEREFNISFGTDGTVSLDEINPGDFDHVRGRLLDLARSIGDGVVVETECLSADEQEAMAQRLAALLLKAAP